MKTQTMLALLAMLGGTSVLVYAQTGVGKKYDTRDPSVCKSKKEPATGAPSPSQISDYVKCGGETTGGCCIWLMEDVQAEVGKSRPYSAWSDATRDIDISQPVYPIRGTYDSYQCQPAGASPYPPKGKNCSVKKADPFIGTCYKTTFGDWNCKVKDTTDPLKGVTPNMPPPK
jgi:hypothetical protein